MTKGERKFFFSKFGEQYFKHLEQNRGSLIARIYGIFTVKMKGHAEISLMMLSHTLRIPSMAAVQRIYDLKGSTVNREIKMNQKTSRTKTLKDVNLLKLKREEPIILLDVANSVIL